MSYGRMYTPGWLQDALLFVSEQNNLIRDLKKENGQLKRKVIISSQKSVIQLQGELLTEQLQSLQTTVKTSVEDSVKAELVSYSAAVQLQKAQTIAPAVVKHVVEEEDRSRSLMVFGLPEEANEDLCDKLGEIQERGYEAREREEWQR